MKVYISGRMSGLPDKVWRCRFYGAYFVMQINGIKAVNPADTIIARNPWLYRLVGYRFTLWYDLQLLKHCTHFTMIGGDWQLSRGARLERMKARKWKITELK